MKYDELVELLMRVAAGGQRKDSLHLSKADDVDSQIKYVQRTQNTFDLIWIKKSVEDPLFQFWKLVKGNALAPTCFVIFTGANTVGWTQELASYETIRWGDLFLLIADTTTTPPVVPSQRGIFRDEE
jgi:hypothetical protein